LLSVITTARGRDCRSVLAGHTARRLRIHIGRSGGVGVRALRIRWVGVGIIVGIGIIGIGIIGIVVIRVIVVWVIVVRIIIIGIVIIGIVIISIVVGVYKI